MTCVFFVGRYGTAIKIMLKIHSVLKPTAKTKDKKNVRMPGGVGYSKAWASGVKVTTLPEKMTLPSLFYSSTIFAEHIPA